MGKNIIESSCSDPAQMTMFALIRPQVIVHTVTHEMQTNSMRSSLRDDGMDILLVLLVMMDELAHLNERLEGGW